MFYQGLVVLLETVPRSTVYFEIMFTILNNDITLSISIPAVKEELITSAENAEKLELELKKRQNSSPPRS